MRILLVQPEYVARGIGFRLAALTEPLHLEMVAALCPEHDVRILDLRLDPDLDAALLAFEPDVVGVTALTTEVYVVADVLERAKELLPRAVTVVGGHHATLLPQDFALPQVDVVVRGEAELSFPPLLRALARGEPLGGVPNLVRREADGRFVRGPEVSAATDLDALPIPARALTAAYREHYFFAFDRPDTTMITARGCPYRCSFCSVWAYHGGRVRKMSPRRVVEEIETVRTGHVTFVDDNFLLDHRREGAIADLVKASGLRLEFGMECRTDSIVRHPELLAKWADVGLNAVFLGLEGATDAAIHDVDKRTTLEINDRAIEICHDHDLMIWGAFLVDPDWGLDDFARLKDYVVERRIPLTQYTILTPLPGTELHRRRHADLLTHDYTCYDAIHAVLPTRLPREVFYQQFAALYRQTDLEPYYDLLRAGRMTVDDLRRGKAVLDAMSEWERYLVNDPVLGAPAAR